MWSQCVWLIRMFRAADWRSTRGALSPAWAPVPQSSTTSVRRRAQFHAGRVAPYLTVPHPALAIEPESPKADVHRTPLGNDDAYRSALIFPNTSKAEMQ
jgi:hypothetical protein